MFSHKELTFGTQTKEIGAVAANPILSYETLYCRIKPFAITSGEKKLALEINKEINKLTGVYAAEKIEITSNEIKFKDLTFFISLSAETRGIFNHNSVLAIIASGNLIFTFCFNSITLSFIKELMS